MIDPDYVMPLFIAAAAVLSVITIRGALPKRRKKVGWITKLFRRATDDDDLALARNSDEFYNSRRWQTVRYKAIVRNKKKYPPHGMCMACHTPFGRRSEKHGDHIKPRSKYPELALVLDNIQILDRDCNFGKGAHDETNWRDIGKSVSKSWRWPWRRAA